MNARHISLNDEIDLSILRSSSLSLDSDCDHFLITEDTLKLSKTGWGDEGIRWERQAQKEEECFAMALNPSVEVVWVCR